MKIAIAIPLILIKTVLFMLMIVFGVSSAVLNAISTLANLGIEHIEDLEG